GPEAKDNQDQRKERKTLTKTGPTKPRHKTKQPFTYENSAKNIGRKTRLNKAKQDQGQNEQKWDQDLPKSRPTKPGHKTK
ncbi:24998_t:CDS:1, partial [Gigaspora margarita]